MKCLSLKDLKICDDPKILAYLSVIGGFLVHLSLGSIYTYGNMAPYITQYMKNNTWPYGSANVGNTIWIFGLAVFGLGASMSIGGFIEEKIGSVATILSGCWIMSFGVLITAWTIKVHLALISISYGLIAGLGTGIAYGVSLAIPSDWFPQSKGFVSGIIVAGFGLGPMIFDFIQTYIINHNVENTELKDSSRVPVSFIIMGSVYAIIQLIGSVMITRPEPTPSETLENNERALTDFFNDEMMSNEVNISPHQLIYELDFWILWITYALNSVVAVLILSLHKVYGVSLNFSDIYLVVASAIGAFCNGIGRIIWGYFNDKISYKILMSFLTMSMAIMLSTFYICTEIGNDTVQNSKKRYVFYFIWIIILHLLLSGSFSLFPTICVKTFGSKNFAGNYGMLFTAYSFSGILTSSLTSNLLTKGQKPINYLPPFLVGAGLSLIASIITLFYRGRSLLYRNVKF